jgi:uncharacterized tellurite resistance protein B-like protein
MTVSDLTHDQLVALVGLLEAIVMADKEVSDPEQDRLTAVADAVGEDMYRALLEDANSRFADLDALKRALAAVADQEARNVVYGVAWEEAVASPSIRHDESELLAWLADTWDIRAETGNA